MPHDDESEPLGGWKAVEDALRAALQAEADRAGVRASIERRAGVAYLRFDPLQPPPIEAQSELPLSPANDEIIEAIVTESEDQAEPRE